MAGQINKILTKYLELRCKGNAVTENAVVAKMILKGLNPKSFDENSKDDPIVIQKIYEMADRHDVDLRKYF